MIRAALRVLWIGVWVCQVRLALAAGEILTPEMIPPIQYAFALAMALLGGSASTLQRYANGAPLERWKLEVARDAVCSTVAGLFCFLACKHWAVPPMLAAILVGISGYGGAKTLEWAWERATKRVAAALGDTEKS
jgi:hypothetical protein